MPYVNIKITRESATAAQNARLIADATEKFRPYTTSDFKCFAELSNESVVRAGVGDEDGTAGLGGSLFVVVSWQHLE